MSDIEKNNLELRKSIESILSLNSGTKIEICSELYIRNHGANEYVVGGVEEKKPYQVNEWKETFSDLEQALNYFFTKRNQYEIGNDFYAQ